LLRHLDAARLEPVLQKGLVKIAANKDYFTVALALIGPRRRW